MHELSFLECIIDVSTLSQHFVPSLQTFETTAGNSSHQNNQKLLSVNKFDSI